MPSNSDVNILQVYSLGKFFCPVDFGSGLDQTGLINFYNLSSNLATSFQAGNATAAVTYTFPTAGPGTSGAILSGTTTGIMSWTNSPTLSGLTMTGNIAMGGNKITGLANGTAATDAAAFGQIHLISIPKITTETTGASTSSTSFVNVSGASVSITPASTSSKILVMAVAPITNSGANVSVMGVNGTTTGDLTTRDGSMARFSGTAVSTVVFMWIDSPASVAAQTYQIRLAANAGTAFIGGNAATGANTAIMVAEVA